MGPLRPVAGRRRLILCPPETKQKTLRKSTIWSISAHPVAVIIGQFIAGQAVTVSRKKRRRKRRENIELEQLEGLDEIWARSYRSPRPEWRLAGRFLDRDAFALFRLYDKLDIGNDYGSVATEVISDWKHWRADKQQPHRGTNISDYISDNAISAAKVLHFRGVLQTT
jgi:hypothetical protein